MILPYAWRSLCALLPASSRLFTHAVPHGQWCRALNTRPAPSFPQPHLDPDDLPTSLLTATEALPQGQFMADYLVSVVRAWPHKPVRSGDADDTRAALDELFSTLTARSQALPITAIPKVLVAVTRLDAHVEPVGDTAFERCIAALNHRIATTDLTSLPSAEAVRLLWAAGRTHVVPKHTVKELRRLLLSDNRIDALSCRELSTLTAAAAKLNLNDEAFAGALGCAVLQPRILQSMHAQGVANIFWGFAKMQVESRTLRENLADRTLHPDVLNHLTAQGIANIIYALALAREKHERLLAALVPRARAPRILRTTQPQDIATLMWSLSVLGVQDGPLTMALCARAAALMPRFSGQEAATLAYAMARLGVRHEAVLESLVRHVAMLRILRALQGQDVAGLVWALATFRYKKGRIFHHLRRQLQRDRVLSRVRVRHGLMCAWAFVRMDEADDKLIERLAEKMLMGPSELLELVLEDPQEAEGQQAWESEEDKMAAMDDGEDDEESLLREWEAAADVRGRS